MTDQHKARLYADSVRAEAGEFERAAHENGRLLWQEQQRAETAEREVARLRGALEMVEKAAQLALLDSEPRRGAFDFIASTARAAIGGGDKGTGE